MNEVLSSCRLPFLEFGKLPIFLNDGILILVASLRTENLRRVQ